MTSLELIEKLQTLTHTIIKESEENFAPLDEEFFNLNLQPNSWSIAQCLNHLNVYAAFYHTQFKEVLSQSEKEAFIENTEEIKYSWLSRNILKYIELDENDLPQKKIKAPKKTFQVNSDFTKKEYDKFIEYQKEILSLLETSKEKNTYRFKKVKTMFPMVSLKAIDMLNIHVQHNYRHFIQAKKVWEKIKIQSN